MATKNPLGRLTCRLRWSFRQGAGLHCLNQTLGFSSTSDAWNRYLEDGLPGRTDTWLITMVSNKSPKDRVGALPNSRFMAYKWG